MATRIFSMACIAMLIVILVGCGGGSQSADNTNGYGAVAGTFMWDAPSSNTDGSPDTDLAGYKIYYGTVSGIYTAFINVGNSTSIPVATLSSAVAVQGLYFIAVTAYDTAGNESGYSNEVSKNL